MALVVAVVLVAGGVALAREELDHHTAARGVSRVPGRVTVIPVAAAQSFNPPPGSGSEHQELVGNLIDGNPGTYWTTEHYANRNFGNLKSGVGAYLRLEAPTTIARMVIASPDTGWTFQVYEASASAAPATLSGWGTSVAQGTVDGPTTTVSLGDHRASYVLLWITRLPVTDFLRVGELTVYS